MVSAADLQAQVEEVDALAATFPSELELSPAEEVALELARAAAALPAAEDGGGGGGSGGGTLGGELSGFVRLPGPPSAASGFGLHFHLPGGYPGAAPRLRVAWDGPRAGGDELQAAVDAAAAELPGQPALFSALAALAVAAEGLLASAGIGGAPGDRYQHVGGGPPGTTQDAAASMEALDLGGGDEGGGGAAPASGAEAEEAAEVWVRRVLWFHHIKSGTKRKQILDAAAELQLGGFSKCGFPGVVIVEGLAGDVDEFTARLRRLRWQAMTVRDEEREAVPPGSDPAARRRLPAACREVPGEDMSALAAACRAAGLEALFLSAMKIAPRP